MLRKQHKRMKRAAALLLVGAMLFSTVTVYAQNTVKTKSTKEISSEIYMPDENLKEAIKEFVFSQTGKKPEKITKELMESLTVLDIQYQEDNERIKDLTGLETAVNVKELYLSNNLIKDLAPLEKLTKLEKVYLMNNPELYDIEVLKRLPHLKKAMLEGTQAAFNVFYAYYNFPDLTLKLSNKTYKLEEPENQKFVLDYSQMRFQIVSGDMDIAEINEDNENVGRYVIDLKKAGTAQLNVSHSSTGTGKTFNLTVIDGENVPDLKVTLQNSKDKEVLLGCRSEEQHDSLSVNITNLTGKTIDLNDYVLKTEETSGTGTFKIDDVRSDKKLKAGETCLLYSNFEITGDCTAEKLSYKAKLYKKSDMENALAVTEEGTVIPFKIKDGVLSYNDASRGEKYRLSFDKDKNINEATVIYGSGGNATEIVNKENKLDFYLDPKNPSDVSVNVKSGYLLDTFTLNPQNAGKLEKISSSDAEEHGAYRFKVTLNKPAVFNLKTKTPVEIKKWDWVVRDYIRNISFENWLSDGLSKHFYETTPSANDAALITIYENLVKYSTVGPYYDAEKNTIWIPYADFVKDTEDLFVNVPDMKKTNVENIGFKYDAGKNMFVRSMGSGGGNAPFLTKVEKVNELGNGTYDIWFKVSHKMIDEEWDRNDPNEYTECTLTVTDNGKGQWKYVSFVEGYTTQPEQPQPEEPEQPQPEEPQNELPGEEVEEIVEQIKDAKPGTTVKVPMGNATVVTKEILAEAKGKNVNVILEMNGYSWTINGKDITAKDLRNINLKVKENVSAIPGKTVKQLADGRATKQITLTHDGAFGFKADLRIYVGKEYAGQYGNIFLYKDGKYFEFVDAGEIDKDGYAVFTMNHASDYVIVVDKKEMSSADIPAELKAPGVPKTADTTNALLYFVMLGAAAAVLMKKITKIEKVKR